MCMEKSEQPQYFVYGNSLNPLGVWPEALFYTSPVRDTLFYFLQRTPLVFWARERTIICLNRMRRTREARLLLTRTFNLSSSFSLILLPVPSGATIPESLGGGCRINCFASKPSPLFFSASLAIERLRPVTNCSSAFLLSKCHCCSLLSDISPCGFMLFLKSLYSHFMEFQEIVKINAYVQFTNFNKKNPTSIFNLKGYTVFLRPSL